MAPKAKKAAKGGDEDGPDPAEMLIILEAQRESLAQRLVMEQERENGSEMKIENLLEEGEKLEEEKDEEIIKTKGLIRGMTHMYREMEKELQTTIKSKETTFAEQEDLKKVLQKDIQDLNAQRERMIAEKEATIQSLRERIDEMSSDFAQILKSCLEKMSERIDFGNQTFQGEEGAGQSAEGTEAPGAGAGLNTSS